MATVLGLWAEEVPAAHHQAFQGVEPGITSEQAFAALCHSTTALTPWRLSSGAITGPRMFFKRPMRCSDWQYFKGATFWGVLGAQADCPSGQVQTAVINVLDGKVWRVNEWCNKP